MFRPNRISLKRHRRTRNPKRYRHPLLEPSGHLFPKRKQKSEGPRELKEAGAAHGSPEALPVAPAWDNLLLHEPTLHQLLARALPMCLLHHRQGRQCSSPVLRSGATAPRCSRLYFGEYQEISEQRQTRRESTGRTWG